MDFSKQLLCTTKSNEKENKHAQNRCLSFNKSGGGGKGGCCKSEPSLQFEIEIMIKKVHNET